MSVPDDSAILYHEGVRDAVNIVFPHVALGGAVALVDRDGVVHLASHTSYEGLNCAEFLVANADNINAAILVLLLNLRQVGDAGTAGGAPRCPELDNVHAIRDIDRVAFHTQWATASAAAGSPDAWA